MFLHIKLVRAL